MAVYGWENFLSERDKLHDLQWGKKELSGFGSEPALVLIDMYYSVVGLTREPIFESMKTWPGSTGLEGWAAVDKTAELLAVARETGVPVVHVKGLDNGMKPWVHRKRGPSTMSAEMKLKGQQICDEVAPIAGEVVEINAAVVADLELLSNDPYGSGWLVKIKPDDPAAVAGLRKAAEYQALVEAESH